MTKSSRGDGMGVVAANRKPRERSAKLAAAWRITVALGILVGLPVFGWGDTVQFTVNPADIGTIYQGGAFDFTSSGLNGTVLSGQTLSLDLVLSNDVLARLFPEDPSALGIELIIDTTAANSDADPGFAGTTTGYLLGPNGDQLGATQTAGRSDASDGSFGVGLVSFTSTDFGGAGAVDISGAEFDTTLPGSGYVITGAQLQFSLNNPSNGVEFGTEQELPEGVSTLTLTLEALFALAFAVLVGLRKRAVL